MNKPHKYIYANPLRINSFKKEDKRYVILAKPSIFAYCVRKLFWVYNNC